MLFIVPSTTKFLAMPPYTPGHQFSGRSRELRLLTDWAASPATPVLIFEAIGGMGKSMLCWQWAHRQLQSTTLEFAGVFWYSFYERGADMGDFCAHALSFTLGGPVDQYKHRKTADLAAELVPVLRKRPWLFVLDGLERTLVAYNRYDAAQVRDEELKAPDTFQSRKPQECIRPADSHLLQALTATAPSKILISSRLMPSALLDSRGSERPGVVHVLLEGLDATDAEALLRSIGVRGDSTAIRNYLTKNFGCHPLIVGVVGGLVNSFRKAPGDYDRWVRDQADENVISPEADLVRSRSRILWTAFEDISEDCRTLLTRLALISESADYETLLELNPRLPGRPEEVYPPSEWLLDIAELVDVYNKEKLAYETYQKELVRWRSSPDFAEAEKFLQEAIQDLTSRGLLQSDYEARKYDLHPVVRGYAISVIAPERRDGVAQPVVDHFSTRQDVRSDLAQNLNDLKNGLQVVRTLLHLGRFEQAADAIASLSGALFWSLEAFDVYLSLVHPLFPNSWLQAPRGIERDTLSWLWNNTGLALWALKRYKEATECFQLALLVAVDLDDANGVLVKLRNLAGTAQDAMQFHDLERLDEIVHAATEILGNVQDLALRSLHRSEHKCTMGDFESAKRYWLQFDALPRPTSRSLYRNGYGEYCLARLHLFQATVDDALLSKIDELAKEGNSRGIIRSVAWLRGEWNLALGNWGKAAEFFDEHIRMTREVNLVASWEEARLALAQLKLGESHPFSDTADRIASVDDPPHAALAELYLALGEFEKARKCVYAAYVEAWSAGPPYVCWRTLEQCRRIYEALGDPEPKLPHFDPKTVQPFSFEAKLSAYLEKKAEEKRTSGDGGSQYVM